jgi:hypothetical protein
VWQRIEIACNIYARRCQGNGEGEEGAGLRLRRGCGARRLSNERRQPQAAAPRAPHSPRTAPRPPA